MIVILIRLSKLLLKRKEYNSLEDLDTSDLESKAEVVAGYEK
jgi:hypothetical protein